MTLKLKIIDREQVLVASYLLLALISWLTTISRPLRDISSHGKTLSMNKKKRPCLFDKVRCLLVPKQWFLHFYLVGIISSSLILRSGVAQRNVYLVGPLLLQVMRRFYECLFVHEWTSNSKMHIVTYFVGIFHYILLPLNFVFDEVPSNNILQIFSIIICIYAQYEQHIHHRILSRLRQVHKSGNYVLPKGRWFNYIGSPQYLTEMIIYLSFWGMLQSNAACSLFIWVWSNQVISSLRSHEWYKNNFTQYKSQNRAVLIPLIF